MGCARNELCFFPFGLWLVVHFSFSFHHLSSSVCVFRFASSLPIQIFSEQTRVVLTSAAYVHLKQADISKYTRNLAPASRAILLSGPAELYQQMLAKALAHYFQAKLLLLDPTDFLIKVSSAATFSCCTQNLLQDLMQFLRYRSIANMALVAAQSR